MLQLRRHYELLPQPEVVSEFYFESHRFLSNSLHLIGQRFIIASFGLLREDHSPGSFDIAFSGVKVHGYPAAGDLVASVMADWTPGKDHGVLKLVEDRVIAGAPSEALADMHTAVGCHILYFVKILAVLDIKRVAGEQAVSLRGMYMAGEQDRVLLVIERQRI